jgi:hypothetical protein
MEQAVEPSASTALEGVAPGWTEDRSQMSSECALTLTVMPKIGIRARFYNRSHLGGKRWWVELGVAQERLNHANINILLEEVRGEAVPQRVW